MWPIYIQLRLYWYTPDDEFVELEGAKKIRIFIIINATQLLAFHVQFFFITGLQNQRLKDEIVKLDVLFLQLNLFFASSKFTSFPFQLRTRIIYFSCIHFRPYTNKMHIATAIFILGHIAILGFNNRNILRILTRFIYLYLTLSQQTK